MSSELAAHCVTNNKAVAKIYPTGILGVASSWGNKGELFLRAGNKDELSWPVMIRRAGSLLDELTFTTSYGLGMEKGQGCVISHFENIKFA